MSKITRKDFIKNGAIGALAAAFGLSKLGNLGSAQAAVSDNTTHENISNGIIVHDAEVTEQGFESGRSAAELAGVVNKINNGATATNKGAVTLSDTLDLDSDENGSIAATPKAIKTLNENLTKSLEDLGNSTTETINNLNADLSVSTDTGEYITGISIKEEAGALTELEKEVKIPVKLNGSPVTGVNFVTSGTTLNIETY